jgi:hypothetical protein
MTERSVRLYANHLALTVRRRGSVLDLFEKKRKIGGPFRSWRALERAIEKYGEAELRRRPITPKGLVELRALTRTNAEERLTR